MTTALVWRTPDRIPPFLDDAEAAGVLDRAQTRAKICLWPLLRRKPHGSGDAVTGDPRPTHRVGAHRRPRVRGGRRGLRSSAGPGLGDGLYPGGG